MSLFFVKILKRISFFFKFKYTEYRLKNSDQAALSLTYCCFESKALKFLRPIKRNLITKNTVTSKSIKGDQNYMAQLYVWPFWFLYLKSVCVFQFCKSKFIVHRIRLKDFEGSLVSLFE